MRIQSLLAVVVLLILGAGFFVGVVTTHPDATLVTERRKVAPLPSFVGNSTEEVQHFFRGVDKYIADRLLFKEAIFRQISTVFSAWFYQFETDRVVRGLDGWLFLGNQYARVVDRHVKDMPVDEARVRGLLAAFQPLQQRAAAHGAPFMVAICPDKHGIYHEFLPPFVRLGPQVRHVEKVAARLQEAGIPVFDLNPGVKAQKSKGILYLKTDTHWNFRGAEAGFQALYAWMQTELLRFPLQPLPAYSLDPVQTWEGDLISIGGYYGFDISGDVDFTVTPAEASQVTWHEQAGTVSDSVSRRLLGWMHRFDATMQNPNASNNLRVLVYCDSFMTGLAPFFNLAFSEVRYVNGETPLADKLKIMDEFKPNLVVFESIERSL